MNESQFGKGAYKDKFDSRDYKWEIIGKASAPFDWNVGFDIEEKLQVRLKSPYFKLPVKNQNGSGSCGGQAWSQYSGVLTAMGTGTFEEESAKYIYAQTFVPGGGSYGRDNAALCVKQGVARENILSSYDKGVPPDEPFMERPQDITQDIRDDASHEKELSYALVNTNIDSVAQAIRDNSGCIIGISGTNNGTWFSLYPQPPKTGEIIWGHWLYAGKAKMIDGKKYIGIINSWGPAVGERGWQWLGEEHFNNFVFNVWTMVFDVNSRKIWLLEQLKTAYQKLIDYLKGRK